MHLLFIIQVECMWECRGVYNTQHDVLSMFLWRSIEYSTVDWEPCWLVSENRHKNKRYQLRIKNVADEYKQSVFFFPEFAGQISQLSDQFMIIARMLLSSSIDNSMWITSIRAQWRVSWSGEMNTHTSCSHEDTKYCVYYIDDT